MAATLQKKQVDAAHMVEPFLTDAKNKLGARVVVDGGGAPVTGLPISGYVSTEDFAAKNPKAAAAFQRAIAKATGARGGRPQGGGRGRADLRAHRREDGLGDHAARLPDLHRSGAPAEGRRHDEGRGLLKQPLDVQTVLFQ